MTTSEVDVADKKGTTLHVIYQSILIHHHVMHIHVCPSFPAGMDDDKDKVGEGCITEIRPCRCRLDVDQRLDITLKRR